jgi:hypothetical protein
VRTYREMMKMLVTMKKKIKLRKYRGLQKTL